MTDQPAYFRYWGKAKKPGQEATGAEYHLLPYHSLDVAAVASMWWDSSPVIRQRFTNISHGNEQQTLAWLQFFIALHDLGKFDVRFQQKVPELLKSLWADAGLDLPSAVLSRNYWHGEYAHFWVYHDLAGRMKWKPSDNPWDEVEGESIWEAWQPWIQAVAGHHGKEPKDFSGQNIPFTDPVILKHDKQARLEFIDAMEALFLVPASLSLDDEPPACDVLFLAGFCSVCDWLGSTTHNRDGEVRFGYQVSHESPREYFNRRLTIARTILKESGLLAKVVAMGGMGGVFPHLSTPRQVQALVDVLPVQQGLTLIEAPTGSGKTEAALAYASYLLAAGVAESIVFALPTQATANAMLDRLLKVAEKLFDQTDVVLAHGKAGFNPQFIDLKKNASRQTPQDADHELEASVHCARWLGQSRKRAFLGQIGVCTVDQVLVSVLPVKHRFVRSFGLGKSVLIIDEVHAYDSYMYGLLNKVLQQQKGMLGSVILLSATLPLQQRQALAAAWGGDVDRFSTQDKYPVITCVGAGEQTCFPLPAEEQQRLAQLPQREVEISWSETPGLLPSDTLLQRMIAAAEAGANVVLICNLVADAQTLARQLSELTALPVDLFHSRFRFKDRQLKEQTVLEAYGTSEQRKRGGLLVATQVVEQSLDLDFDWMITQLCPIDLLFQRLGRLHRHEREWRPAGLEQPQCTVLLPENQQYELHKLIYGNKDAPNSRILWRTEQVVRRNALMRFPAVYRPMIEEVYQEEAWSDEPEEIVREYERFWKEDYASHLKANLITNVHAVWGDDDSNVNLMTRDGEMSLNIVPVTESPQGQCFLGRSSPLSALEEWQRAEQIMLNTVPAPASWKKKGLPVEQEGIIWLVMSETSPGRWECATSQACFSYTVDAGLMVEQLNG